MDGLLQDCYSGWTKSISHRLRNHRMIRFPYQQTAVSAMILQCERIWSIHIMKPPQWCGLGFGPMSRKPPVRDAHPNSQVAVPSTNYSQGVVHGQDPVLEEARGARSSGSGGYSRFEWFSGFLVGFGLDWLVSFLLSLLVIYCFFSCLNLFTFPDVLIHYDFCPNLAVLLLLWMWFYAYVLPVLGSFVVSFFLLPLLFVSLLLLYISLSSCLYFFPAYFLAVSLPSFSLWFFVCLCLCSFVCSCLPAWLFAWLFACLPACLLACLLVCLFAGWFVCFDCSLACLLTCL